MKARRTFRRRIVIVALVATLCGIAALVLVIGLMRLQAVERRNAELQSIHTQVLGYLGDMQREVALLEFQVESASAERLLGLLEECGEALADLRENFARLLAEQPASEQMEDEWSELFSAEGRNGWARYATDLGAFEEHFDAFREGVEERLALARQTALGFCGAGVVATSVALLLCLWLLLTVLSDIASDSYDPDALGEEVEDLATNAQFKTRINLLLSPQDREDTHDDWQLKMTQRFAEQRTHVCFEALASRNGRQVRLWGRRYKWAGYVKSFQRLFFPAFGEATWRALCLMHNNGLGSPMPIVFKRLHAGPFRAGAIILMEHVGDVKSVREFLKSGFCLLSEEKQHAFVQRIVGFLHSLHGLGIYGVKPRYLHAEQMKAPDRMQLYLFDLDKVLLWTSCPSFIGSILRSKDYRRLLREVEPVLSRARLLKLQECLKASRKVGTQET